MSSKVTQMDLSKIGGIVKSDAHGTSSWDGQTVAFCGRFDADPTSFYIGQARSHLIEARPLVAGAACPDGFIRCVAFRLADPDPLP